jgi:ATP-binding cassette subfamily F protein 3
MLTINNLTFRFGSRTIYENASLHIHDGDHIGIIGANGTGKSTLLRIISGEYKPDGGTISKSNDCTVGFLNQDLLSYLTDDSILQVAMQAFERGIHLQQEIEKLYEAMATEYTDEMADRLATLQTEFDMMDGYTMQARAEEMLEGLGFATKDLSRPLREFSGGWRMRVMLAKLLLQNPSLLMLDEPTNHLDLPSIQWIENYLRSYTGAFIVVSHDRQFLDNTINKIVEVYNNELVVYSGNYSFYVEEKALRSEIQQKSFENQQAQIRQMERFIDRFRAKATKAKQVQSRIKALERIDMIEAVDDDNPEINIKFTFSQPSGKEVCRLENISKSYGDLKILEKSNGLIARGDKIALIGANGKGKSTVLRIISGKEPLQEGTSTMGYNVRTTFFAQHQLEALNLDNTLLEELKQAGSNKTEVELRTILGCFLFSGDEVNKKIKVLSGGEKSRVALAKMLISESNFLLLDEPTNHLDMLSVNILIQALQNYEGSFVVVSHDRYFISNVANKIWYIENHELKEYLGTYDEYEYWRQQREKEKQQAAKNATATAAPVVKKEVTEKKTAIDENEWKEKQKQLKKQQQLLENIETIISDLEKTKKQLEIDLAANYNEELSQQYTAIEQKLAQKNEEWEKLALQIDEMSK